MTAWVIADTHFGHKGITEFFNYDGTKTRPWDNVEDMDNALIENWNRVVRDEDRVYLLGDVAMNKRGFMGAVPRLKGRIVLVKGNHDTEKLSLYAQYFEDVRAYVVKKGYVLSHIPVHVDSLARWGRNIHGHLHNNVVRLTDGNPDPRYVCVSVEQINYTPMRLETLVNNP